MFFPKRGLVNAAQLNRAWIASRSGSSVYEAH